MPITSWNLCQTPNPTPDTDRDRNAAHHPPIPTWPLISNHGEVINLSLNISQPAILKCVHPPIRVHPPPPLLHPPSPVHPMPQYNIPIATGIPTAHAGTLAHPPNTLTLSLLLPQNVTLTLTPTLNLNLVPIIIVTITLNPTYPRVSSNTNLPQ